MIVLVAYPNADIRFSRSVSSTILHMQLSFGGPRTAVLIHLLWILSDIHFVSLLHKHVCARKGVEVWLYS